MANLKITGPDVVSLDYEWFLTTSMSRTQYGRWLTILGAWLGRQFTISHSEREPVWFARGEWADLYSVVKELAGRLGQIQPEPGLLRRPEGIRSRERKRRRHRDGAGGG